MFFPLVESAKEYAERMHAAYKAVTKSLEDKVEEFEEWRKGMVEWRLKNEVDEGRDIMEQGGRAVVMRKIQEELSKKVRRCLLDGSLGELTFCI